MESYVLALDIGTSSVRAALYDFQGNVLPETFVKNERQLTATDDGGAEIDALEGLKQIEQAIDDVLERSAKLEGEISHVAASSFWHSLVGVDAKAKPTTKVFGWADTRSRNYVQVLREKLNESTTHNRTGARFHSSFWTAKLLWLKKEFPEIFKQTDKWLSFSDFIALKLFVTPSSRRLSGGHLARRAVNKVESVSAGSRHNSRLEAGITAFTSVSMASATGIFDIRVNDWDEELINFLKIKRANLPEIVAEDAQTFGLNSKYQKRWTQLKDTKWFPAIGDGAANNIGAGCVEKSKAALMIGTSGAMRVAFAGEIPKQIPNGLWCYRIDRKRIIIGGALSDGGGLYSWLKENFRLKDDDNKTEAEIEKRDADAHGLTFLPFLAGERGTGYHENAHGAVLGLKSATDTIDIVQAALESVAYRFAEIFDQLHNICKVREIIASGGALRESPVWTQIISDVLQQNMSLPDTREASSRGAVLLALETIGKMESIENLETPKGREFKFDKKRSAIYRKARKRHENFYELLINK